MTWAITQYAIEEKLPSLDMSKRLEPPKGQLVLTQERDRVGARASFGFDTAVGGGATRALSETLAFTTIGLTVALP